MKITIDTMSSTGQKNGYFGIDSVKKTALQEHEIPGKIVEISTDSTSMRKYVSLDELYSSITMYYNYYNKTGR